MGVRHHRDLDVWKVGMELAVESYRIARILPSIERFELGSQLRRAAVSIPSNIAEGHARGTRREYQQHISNACGSCAEIDTQLSLVELLDYLPAEQLVHARELCSREGRMLTRLRQALRR